MRARSAGVLGAMWPAEFGGTPPDQLDAFHTLIFNDELARAADGGLLAGMFSFGIALPPVIKWGSEEMKRKARDAAPFALVGSLMATCADRARRDPRQ
jgi:acyl-CoA dehydrogenase